MPYFAVISKAIDKVPFLTVRGFLVKERGVSVAISDPHVFCLLVPHGTFSIKPTIKGFTDLLYMLKVMQWILFKDLGALSPTVLFGVQHGQTHFCSRRIIMLCNYQDNL